MVKGATAKADRAKKGSHGSSLISGALLPGWIQGKWMMARVSKGCLLELEIEGLVVRGS